MGEEKRRRKTETTTAKYNGLLITMGGHNNWEFHFKSKLIFYFFNEKSQFSSILAPIHNLEQTKQQCLVKHILPPHQIQILAPFPYHRAEGLQHVRIKSALYIYAKPSSRSAVLLTTDL